MNYYKVIYNDEVSYIGTSSNFRHYQKKLDTFLIANESHGDFFLADDGKIFRDDSWMIPIKSPQIEYISSKIIQIKSDDFEILKQALIKNEIILENTKENEILEENQNIEESINEDDKITLEFIKTSKVKQLSYDCSKAIEKGFDLILDNKKYHFSLSLEDQINLNTIQFQILRGQSQNFVYHADGELMREYTKEEMQQIIDAADKFRQQHLQHFNILKNYVENLNSIEQISKIQYK